MTIKLIEKKIDRLSGELKEIKSELAQLKKKTRSKAAKNISIGFSVPGNELTKLNYPFGVTLGNIIEEKSLTKYRCSVNGSFENKDYILQNGDIIIVEGKALDSRKQNFNEWKKLASEVSKKWIGKADAVEEIRYQRSKYD